MNTLRRIVFLLALGTLAVCGGLRAQVSEIIGILPDGKSIIIRHSVIIDDPTAATGITSQGTVSGSNFAAVPTDDPDTAALADPTITPISKQPPVAMDDYFERYPTQSIKIPVATILANDSDPDGGPVTLDSVVSPSANGATVTVSGGRVFYLPNGFTGADSFEYTIRDDEGVPATATVIVALVVEDEPGSNGTGTEVLPDGSLRVGFAAIPGRSYNIESTDSLTPPIVWSVRATLTADGNGRIVFTDPAPLPPARYYRTVQQ